jgi:ribosome modulation factor
VRQIGIVGGGSDSIVNQNVHFGFPAPHQYTTEITGRGSFYEPWRPRPGIAGRRRHPLAHGIVNEKRRYRNVARAATEQHFCYGRLTLRTRKQCTWTQNAHPGDWVNSWPQGRYDEIETGALLEVDRSRETPVTPSAATNRLRLPCPADCV